MNRKAWSTFSIKSIDEEARTIQGMASTPSPDRANDIVEPLGAKFSLPMPFLWQHDSSLPVGQVIAANPTSKGIPVTIQLVKIDEPGTLKERLDEAWQSIKAKLVRGLSIGFMPIPGETERLANGGLHFKEWNWLELSAVTIPCNQEASILAIKRAGRRALPVVKFAEPFVEPQDDYDADTELGVDIIRHIGRKLLVPMADEIGALKKRVKMLEGK